MSTSLFEQLPERTTPVGEEHDLGEVDLVMQNMREALLYTRECCGGKIPDDALVSLCYETMLKSAKIYKPGHLRFFSYAKARLRGALKRYWSSLSIVRNGSTVAINALDSHGGDHARQDDDELSLEVIGGSIEPDFDRIFMNDTWDQISKIMARRCDDFEATVIFLAYRMQLSFTEIGKLLDVSRQFASITAQKGLKKIRRALKKN